MAGTTVAEKGQADGGWPIRKGRAAFELGRVAFEIGRAAFSYNQIKYWNEVCAYWNIIVCTSQERERMAESSPGESMLLEISQYFKDKAIKLATAKKPRFPEADESETEG